MRKRLSEKVWNWRIVFETADKTILKINFNMKLTLLALVLTISLVQLASAEVALKQNTVDNYLQKAAARAVEKGQKANHLIHQSSPYLLQHAYNPVNWYAWGDEAFAKARKENKPIFLSIGYSTCHWCHVMARESFENKEIAAILNKYFISIKVDREQRPDIDAVYMSATQLINGSGGWPMSVFLDNKLRPFHAATYYPPFSSEGRTGLEEILLKIEVLWKEQPEVINEVARSVTARISAYADDTAESINLAVNINKVALQHIVESYDAEDGGFSNAPKFPSPGIFAFLNQLALNAKQPTSDKNEIQQQSVIAKKMMNKTLDAMAAGGIYDQLAGGFHRYSVDANWHVPHFEKMLYTQALMVLAYSDLYQLEKQKTYKNIVTQTLAFVKHEMRLPAGGFYSALDADSERADKPGERAEGTYYLWHQSELKKLLSKDEFSFVKKYYNVEDEGNIYSDPQNQFVALNILYINEDFRDIQLSVQQSQWLQSARKKLNAKRYQRPRPHLDDKIITAWNGMMISALAKASRIFSNAEYLKDAKQTIAFIKRHSYDKKTGKLFRLYREQAGLPGTSIKASTNIDATLPDYVWLINGLLETYKTGNEKQYLQWALVLQEKQDMLFLDESSGAYFESTANDTSILFKSKTIYDGALPSANAIALANLRQFMHLAKTKTEKQYFSTQAEKLIASFAAAINEDPSAAAMLLSIELEDSTVIQ